MSLMDENLKPSDYIINGVPLDIWAVLSDEERKRLRREARIKAGLDEDEDKDASETETK